MNRLYYSDIRLLEGNCCSELRLTIPTANPNTCIFLMLFWDSKSPNIPIKEIENNSTRVKNLVQGSSASSSRPWLRISTPSFFDPSLAKGGRVGQLTQLRWSLKQTLGEFPLHLVYGRKNTRTREISQRLSCSCQLGHSCNLSGYKDHEKYIPSLSLVIGAKEFLSHIVVFGFATLYCKFQSTIVFAHITMVVRGSLRVVLTAVWSSDDQCPEQSLGHLLKHFPLSLQNWSVSYFFRIARFSPDHVSRCQPNCEPSGWKKTIPDSKFLIGFTTFSLVFVSFFQIFHISPII